MSPVTHLLASWLVAAGTTDNLRDRRLVTLSGILPDLDGAGILVDFARQTTAGGNDFFFYHKYHHVVLHGLFGAGVIALMLACFARRRWSVAALAFLLVHLHLLCDFVGSRGPSASDIWTIDYFAPFRSTWVWSWSHQWPLASWPNYVLTVVLLAGCVRVTIVRGESFVGVFNRRADHIFVSVLREWWKKARRSSGRDAALPSQHASEESQRH